MKSSFIVSVLVTSPDRYIFNFHLESPGFWWERYCASSVTLS